MPPLWLLTVAVVVGGVWLVIQLKELFVLLLVGYFLAYAVDPIVSRLERKGVSRALAFSFVLIVMVSVCVLAGVTAIPTIIDEFQKLSANLSSYIETSKDKIGPLLDRARMLLPEGIQSKVDFQDLSGSVVALLSQVSGDTLKKLGDTLISTLMQGYSRALTLVNVALLPFIVFYLSVDLPRLHGFFLSLFPITKRAKVAKVCGEIDLYVSSFVRGQALVCSILFVLYAIGLGLVGVDLWLLLAAIAGFGNMVPYVGTVSGIILSSLMALVTFGDFSHVLWTLGVFGAVQVLDGTLITPRVIGESVGLSPLIIILALFAGGQLFGLLGIFLAIPAAATLRVLVRYSYNWARNS
jgi:predicted PurR-regulated permease PerM